MLVEKYSDFYSVQIRWHSTNSIECIKSLDSVDRYIKIKQNKTNYNIFLQIPLIFSS